jgi:hypothetical protein
MYCVGREGRTVPSAQVAFAVKLLKRGADRYTLHHILTILQVLYYIYIQIILYYALHTIQRPTAGYDDNV